MKIILYIFVTYLFINSFGYSKELFKNITIKDNLPDNYITCFEQFNNTIWIGTSKGIAKYKNNKIEKVITKKNGIVSDFVVSMTKLNGSLYVCSLELASSKCGAITKFEKNNKITSFCLPENAIITNSISWKNKIWITTWNSGLFSFDPENNNWKIYTVDNGLVENSLISIYGNKNNLYIGSLKSGFSEFNGKTFKTYNEHVSELINNPVSAICCSNTSCYFGTYAGLSVYTPNTSNKKNWRSYTIWGERLISNYIKSIYIKDNIVWLGTDAGVTKFNISDSSWKSYKLENGLIGKRIFTINCFNNSMWFGTDKGISILEF